ncbi:MAG: putative manganese transporter [Firmicutes bacterium]|nr:putative manganese transporter [Bacillota bacterium]MDY5336320.1 putative manganese transporter [Bacilli bacterium]
MKEVILDTIVDSLKLIPFLLVAFLIIELLEHKLNNKTKNILTKSKKIGPIIGSLLGVIPQCGFSVMATNLYITRIITLGTLISIYLSTSDEMLIIMISEKVEISLILKILLIKIFFGIVYGLIIDKIINKKKKDKETNYELCDEEHCDCNHSILLSAIKHTLHITLFIFIITLIINAIFTLLGDNYLSKLLLNNSILSPFITSLIGLIPNCAASVILTELYLNSTISLGALIGGLLTSSGSSLLVLIKNNKNQKENLSIILLLYALGVLSGIIIELISLIK